MTFGYWASNNVTVISLFDDDWLFLDKGNFLLTKKIGSLGSSNELSLCNIITTYDMLGRSSWFCCKHKKLIWSIVLRTGPDWEVDPWKPGTGMKIGFLSIKNWAYVAIPWTPKTKVGPHEPMARTVRSNPLAIFLFFIFIFIKIT